MSSLARTMKRAQDRAAGVPQQRKLRGASRSISSQEAVRQMGGVRLMLTERTKRLMTGALGDARAKAARGT